MRSGTTKSRDARFWNRTARKYAGSKIADPDGYERSLARCRAYLRATDRLFEFGCGTGTTALRLAPHVAELVATDISAEMIAIARERAAAQGCTNATFQTADPAAMEPPDAGFDAVAGFNVLHLVADRAAVLRNLYRMLKPGGHFISKTVCLGDAGWPARLAFRALIPAMQLAGKAPSVAFLGGGQLEREIAAAGFEIAERDRHGSKGRDMRPFLVARKPR